MRGIFARVSGQENRCRDAGANCRKLPAFVDIAVRNEDSDFAAARRHFDFLRADLSPELSQPKQSP
jgi:hypothetical protein